METLSINVNYSIGQGVYLVTDPDQHMRIVTAIIVRQGGLLYELSYGAMANTHSDCEISEHKNVVNY